MGRTEAGFAACRIPMSLSAIGTSCLPLDVNCTLRLASVCARAHDVMVGSEVGGDTTVTTGNLTVKDLTALVEAKEIDTVIIEFTDMQGRLIGKRASARLFLEELAE